MEGIVKWVDYEKGHGFITPDGEGGGGDVVFFLSGMENANLLCGGSRVTFRIFHNPMTGRDVATDIDAFDGNRVPVLVPNAF